MLYEIFYENRNENEIPSSLFHEKGRKRSLVNKETNNKNNSGNKIFYNSALSNSLISLILSKIARKT